MTSELVVDHRQALLIELVVPLCLARGARVLQIPEAVKAKPANPVAIRVVRLKTDGFGQSGHRLLIAAGEIERDTEPIMAVVSERVEHDGAASGRKASIEVPHEGCKFAA